MGDPLGPPRATRPEEVCRLIADAVSDGDLDAALAHYEPEAVVELADGTLVSGHDSIRRMLGGAIGRKLLYDLGVDRLMTVSGLALVVGEWTSRGTDVDGRPSTVRGRHRSVVRRGPDGFWRLCIESIAAHT